MISLEGYALSLLDDLEDLPVVSRERWLDACSHLESAGGDASILDEFATEGHADEDE